MSHLSGDFVYLGSSALAIEAISLTLTGNGFSGDHMDWLLIISDVISKTISLSPTLERYEDADEDEDGEKESKMALEALSQAIPEIIIASNVTNTGFRLGMRDT
jgi:hypothetical protein